MRMNWSLPVGLWLTGLGLALLLLLSSGCASRPGPQPQGTTGIISFFKNPLMPLYKDYQPTNAPSQLVLNRVADNLWCGLVQVDTTGVIARAGCRRWLPGQGWGPWEPEGQALEEYLWPYTKEHAL